MTLVAIVTSQQEILSEGCRVDCTGAGYLGGFYYEPDCFCYDRRPYPKQKKLTLPKKYTPAEPSTYEYHREPESKTTWGWD